MGENNRILVKQAKKMVWLFYLINSNVHTKEKINKGTITYNADEEQTSIETQIHFQKNILSNYIFLPSSNKTFFIKQKIVFLPAI